MVSTLGGRLQTLWREWIRALLIVLVVVGSFRSAVADWNDVPTGSMKPTILEGDRILVNKLAYDLRVPFTRVRIAAWDAPDRGDIVVLFSPADGKRLVKRVVALPGDSIAMRNGVLRINGAAVPYAPLDGVAGRVLAREQLGEGGHTVMLTPGIPAMRTFGPIHVPPGSYFVLGDNRDESGDSRYFGFVPRPAIVGRAVAVAASVDPERHYLPRWGRFFRDLE